MIASLPTLTPTAANDDTHASGAFGALRAILGVGFLASLAMTYPMWLCERPFPLIPISQYFTPFPAPLALGFLALLAALIVTTIVTPSGFAAATIVAQVLILWAQDQNRIHPWAFLAILLYGALAALWLRPLRQRKIPETVTLMQFVIITMYAWTGLQKIRWSYFTEIVPRLVASDQFASSSITTALLYAAPGLEVTLAVALLIPKLRRIGAACAIFMHLAIIAMASPLGRAENYSIIPWNLMMVGILPLLFWQRNTSARAIMFSNFSTKRLIYWILCVVLPALGYVGLWNPYLSFSVYSGAGAQGYAFLQEEATTELPPTVTGALIPAEGGLQELPFDAWGMATLKSPPSPQLSHLYEMGRHLCRTVRDSNDRLAVIIRTPPLPWEKTITDDGYICHDGELVPSQ